MSYSAFCYYFIFYSVFCSTLYSVIHSLFYSTFDSVFNSVRRRPCGLGDRVLLRRGSPTPRRPPDRNIGGGGPSKDPRRGTAAETATGDARHGEWGISGRRDGISGRRYGHEERLGRPSTLLATSLLRCFATSLPHYFATLLLHFATSPFRHFATSPFHYVATSLLRQPANSVWAHSRLGEGPRSRLIRIQSEIDSRCLDSRNR